MANPNIALSFRAPQIRSPLETYGRAQQIAANAMTMQKAAREAAATDAVKNYIAKGGKFETSADLENAARAGVPMDVAAQYAEIAGKQREATTKVRESAEARLLGRLPRIAQTGDDMAWQRWLTDWRAIDETDADEMMRLSGGKADRNIIYSIMAGAKEYFQKNVPAAVASVQFAPGGEAFDVTVGGTTAPKAEEVIVTSRGGAPAAPSTAAAPPVMAPRQTPMAAPATTEQLDAAADAITKGAPLNDPVLRDLSDEDFKEAQRRASRMTLEQPISFEPGAVEPLTVETAPQIIQTAIQTGTIDQSHVEQLRQMVGPENDQALANWMQQNNVRIQPSGAPSMRSAVYRPVAGENLMRNVENEVGRQFRGRDPMQSPAPGVYGVPTGRVRDISQAQRETPEEVYQKELARRRAERDALKESGPKPLTPVQEAKLRDNIAKDYKAAQSTLDMMLNPVSGVIAAVQGVRNLTPEQKEAITGWSGYAPSITASSRSADTKVKNLMGKVTEMGKAAASLTGAIGQMAVQEWRIVRDMIANLDLEGMEASDLDDQLEIIETQARRAAAITQDAYENQYVEEFARYPGRFQLKAPPTAGAPKQTTSSRLPRVRSDADFNRLKPGTLFIDPNGETRRKP